MTEHDDLKLKADEVIEIVKCVNIHNHTRACKKYDTTCRFGFLKFPIWKTLLAKPLPVSERKENLEKYSKILADVKTVLMNKAVIGRYSPPIQGFRPYVCLPLFNNYSTLFKTSDSIGPLIDL